MNWLHKPVENPQNHFMLFRLNEIKKKTKKKLNFKNFLAKVLDIS
jgi:hypothetical protein